MTKHALLLFFIKAKSYLLRIGGEKMINKNIGFHKYLKIMMMVIIIIFLSVSVYGLTEDAEMFVGRWNYINDRGTYWTFDSDGQFGYTITGACGGISGTWSIQESDNFCYGLKLCEDYEDNCDENRLTWFTFQGRDDQYLIEHHAYFSTETRSYYENRMIYIKDTTYNQIH